MSRGYDCDNREDDRDQEPGQPSQPGSRPPVQGRTGGDSSNPERRCSEQRRDRDRRAPRRERVMERLSMRSIEKWYGLSDRERTTLREVGRFRTIDAEALSKYRYAGKPAAFQKEIARLQQQGLLLRRSISVGKHRDTLVIVALTEEAARLVRQDAQGW